MWRLPLAVLVLTLLYLGMWRGRHTCRSVGLIGCRFAATAHRLGKPTFVMAGDGRYMPDKIKEGSYMTPVSDRRHKRLLTQVSKGSGLEGQRKLMSGDLTSQDLRHRKVPPGSCALHSSPTQECGGVMGHIEEHLLRLATTKGSPKQLVALRSLKLLIENDPNCIKHLLRFNILDVLVTVLQQPYKKNLWELMNSYIWSGSSLENVHLKMIQDTVLSTLILLARRSGTIRSLMAKDERFKGLLLRIYLCEMKNKKKLTVSAAGVGGSSDLAQQVGGISTNGMSNGLQDTATLMDDPVDGGTQDGDSVHVHEASGMKGESNSVTNNEDDAGSRVGSMTCDTQLLLRNLFHSFGYDINEDTVMKRYERAIESSGSNDSALDDTGGLVAHCEGLDNTQNKTKSEYTLHPPTDDRNISQDVDDTPSESTIIWIPYAFRRKDGDEIAAIRRHLHINIGDDIGVVGNLDCLDTVTLDSAGNAPGDIVFGMVALSSNNRLSDGGLNYEFSTQMVGPAIASRLKRSGDPGYRYSVISNIRIASSLYLNGQTLAANLLRRLNTAASYVVLNDIVREIWMLIGSKDKDVLELVYHDLDLERLAEIINHTSLHTISGGKTLVEALPMDKRNVLHQIYHNLRHMLHSYISSVMPTFLGTVEKYASNYSRGFFSKYNTDASDTEGVTGVDAKVELGNNATDSPCTIDHVRAVAWQLQAAIFGMLIDVIYMKGNESLCAIRDCLPLVEALKRARAGFPSLSKFVDVVDHKYENFCSILDKRRANVHNETHVIHNELDKIDIHNVGELQAKERDEFGNFISMSHTWASDSWMRQKCVNSLVIGAIFNGHKLLNILGHHEQQRFKHRGLRILSIDGGGSKGVVALEVLKKLETTIGRPLHEVFDIICGTSCGGLLGALLALEKARVSDIQTIFESMMPRVFTRDSYRVTGTRLFLKQAYYDEGVLYNYLRQCFGNMELIDYSVDPTCPKFFCLSVQMDVNPMKPIVWRNYNYPPEACIIPDSDTHPPPRDGSFAIHAADAIRATTAAPMYFPLLERNGHLYGDGALHANNPSLIAMFEANLVYPNVPIECIVSVGTGRTSGIPGKRKAGTDIGADVKKGCKYGNASIPRIPDTGSMVECKLAATNSEDQVGDDHNVTFDLKDVLLRSLSTTTPSDPKSLGLDQLINHIISSATNTEGVHAALQTLMDGSKYFRFNPPIPTVHLDNTTPEVLADLKTRAKLYLEEEMQKTRMARIGRLLR